MTEGYKGVLKTTSNDTLSILICSKDRHEALDGLVKKIQKIQMNYMIEIVVVEETNTPAPLEGVIYVSHAVANRGIPYARNLALAHATGELIVFIDDDCTIHDFWLNKLLAPFQDASVLGVQGGVTVPPSTNAVGWVEAIVGVPGGNIKRVFESEGKAQETNEISTLNCAYRKWAVDKVGGFDARLKITGEDYILAKEVCKLGRCLFVPDAMVCHEARGSLYRIWKWFVRRGRADIDVIRVTGWDWLKYQWLMRSSLLLKILLLFVLCLFFPNFAVALTISAFLLYFLSQYVRYYDTWKMAPISLKPFLLVPVVKFVMDFAMDIGRLAELRNGAHIISDDSRKQSWNAPN
jgi:GT2 family glycosyltransferase